MNAPADVDGLQNKPTLGRHTHENHESTFMILLRPADAAASKLRLGAALAHALGVDMIWQTPTAIDFRFGMEITMYVSNR